MGGQTCGWPEVQCVERAPVSLTGSTVLPWEICKAGSLDSGCLGSSSTCGIGQVSAPVSRVLSTWEQQSSLSLRVAVHAPELIL